MSTDAADKELVEQEHALRIYLSSLLYEDAPVVEQAQNIPVELKKRDVRQVAQAAQSEKITLMTFKLAGLRLSVPLKHFSGIQTLVDEINITRQCNWYAGSVESGEQKIHIIDSYRLVIPKNKQTVDMLQTDYYGKTVVLLNRGTIGLLCDEATKVTSVDSSDIVWRTDQTSRNWLAGTVASYSMAILNVEFIDKMVKDYLSGTKSAETIC